MNSPAHDLVLWLVDQGELPAFGGDLDWAGHVQREPVEPDNVVTLYDTGGAEVELPREGQLERPSFQIRVRGRSYQDCYNRQRSIRETLVENTTFLSDEFRYFTPLPTSDILDIGRDDNDRFRLTANYSIYRHQRGDLT